MHCKQIILLLNIHRDRRELPITLSKTRQNTFLKNQKADSNP